LAKRRKAFFAHRTRVNGMTPDDLLNEPLPPASTLYWRCGKRPHGFVGGVGEFEAAAGALSANGDFRSSRLAPA